MKVQRTALTITIQFFFFFSFKCLFWLHWVLDVECGDPSFLTSDWTHLQIAGVKFLLTGPQSPFNPNFL